MLSLVFLVLADEGAANPFWGALGCLSFLTSTAFAVFLCYWIYQRFFKPLPSATEIAIATTARALTIANGVFFGTYQGKRKSLPIFRIGKPQNADGHVLVVGGAGSGKSSCIAIPTLRDSWQATALVVDIKGELYAKSKRPRAYVFNPMNTSAKGYDPFYLLQGNENPIPDIRDIALTLCPMETSVKDPFWIQAAQNILTGHLLYGFKNGAGFTETIEVLQSVPPKKLLETEMKDKDACRYLLQYADLKTETLSGIMAELSNKVMPFATDPYIQATLSKKEIITPRLLEEGYDIFLQLPEHKIEQWRPMISLIVQQFSRHFEKRPDEGATPILFMLDEFARLGKMEAVVYGLATLRSKHITIMPIIQSLAQLDAVYGPDQRKVICDNCSYKAILQATDADSQAYFSKLVGTEERRKVTHTSSGLFSKNSDSTSTTTEEKPIIKPEEFAYLTCVVLLTPYGFVVVQKVPYYETAPLMESQPVSSSQASTPVPLPSSIGQLRLPETLTKFAASVPLRGEQWEAKPEPLSQPPLAKPLTPTSQQGFQGKGVQQPEQFAPSTYAKRRQQEQAVSTQGNGQKLQAQKQQPVTPSSTSALQEQHQRSHGMRNEIVASKQYL